MNIPIELLSSYILSYFNKHDALEILPFLAKKHQRVYLVNLQSKYNIINRFMKKTYFKLYNNLCHKKLSTFLVNYQQWLSRISVTSLGLGHYLTEIQTVLTYEFPQYSHLIDDFNFYRRPWATKNITQTKVILGSSWSNLHEPFENNTHHIFTPQWIHRLYPVDFRMAVKIKNSPLLSGLLF
tara:strand:+ start:2676 stop:3221 length:546 start_codon:yes stop_codon:yes gene_type:complete